MATSALVSAPPAYPDISAFMFASGRLPRLGDEIAPWRYRGWLLCITHLADLHPLAPGRWLHYSRVIVAGHLIDEPIPQIEFTHHSDGMRMLQCCIEIISSSGPSWSALTDFVDWLAWGLAVSSEEPKLPDSVQEQLYRTFNLEPLLLHPYDYLGEFIAEHRTRGWNPNAFFPTSHNVVECMVRMTIGGGGGSSSPCAADSESVYEESRVRSVLDPCVGSGRMLLHASNLSYCLYGQDIDPLMVNVTKINGALYAPWIAFPFSDRILRKPLPPPPPALLPVPEQYQPPQGVAAFRCDDRGQGLLFV